MWDRVMKRLVPLERLRDGFDEGFLKQPQRFHFFKKFISSLTFLKSNAPT
jgi:hypothetical protein